jgi:hypothetical protein
LVDSTLAIQYGALGAALLVAIAAVKVLFNREVEAHKREQERADRLEAELKQINELVRTQYVEKLAAATQTIGEALSVLRRTP